MHIGSKGALLVMVLVISVSEMTVPAEGARGEYMKNKTNFWISDASVCKLSSVEICSSSKTTSQGVKAVTSRFRLCAI